MALGCTIGSTLNRSSHIFTINRVCLKTDWLEQLNDRYIQVPMSLHLLLAAHCNHMDTQVDKDTLTKTCNLLLGYLVRT